MKKILHLTIFLAVIAAIAGGALAFANDVTAPIIEKNALASEQKNLKKLFPDADSFQSVEVKKNAKYANIQKIFAVENGTYIFKMEVKGYKDGTVYLVAIDKSGKIVNYVVDSQGDTKDIGTQVADQPFIDTLIGKDASGQLDTITGATISSTPVIDGIHEAAAYYAQYLK